MSSTYFMLDCRAPGGMLLGHLPDVGDQSWFEGQPFTSAVPNPLIVRVLEGYEDAKLLEYFPDLPLMRADLVETLQRAGVDNVHAYDVIIRNDGTDLAGYKAVNIIGVMSVAGAETVYNPSTGARLIDADIDTLGIDSSRARDQLLFRLAESVNGVVIHGRLRSVLEKAGFQQLTFYDPKDWVG